MTSEQRAWEILYETEAALRLVDQGLRELRDETPDSELTAHSLVDGELTELSGLLERANTQILEALGRLSDRRERA